MSIVSMTSRWASNSEAGSELVLEQNKSSATGIKAGIRKVSAFSSLANRPSHTKKFIKPRFLAKLKFDSFLKLLSNQRI